jgi:hypothetical protein
MLLDWWHRSAYLGCIDLLAHGHTGNNTCRHHSDGGWDRTCCRKQKEINRVRA